MLVPSQPPWDSVRAAPAQSPGTKRAGRLEGLRVRVLGLEQQHVQKQAGKSAAGSSWGRAGGLVQAWLEPAVLSLRGPRRAAARAQLVPHAALPRLAALGASGAIPVYDLTESQGKLLEPARALEPLCCAWHPSDAGLLCVGAADGLHLWARERTRKRDRGESLRPGREDGFDREVWTAVCTRRHEAVSCLAYSPGGLFVAAGGESGIAVWESDRLLDELPVEEPVRLGRWRGGRCVALAWSPFAHIPCLAAAYEDDTLRLWDTQTWEQVSYTVAWKGVASLAWSMLSSHLLVCDGRDLSELVFPGRTARRPWHLAATWADAGAPVAVHPVPHAAEDDAAMVGAVRCAALCPATGERLALLFEDSPTVFIYEVSAFCESRPCSLALLGSISDADAIAVAFAVPADSSGSLLAVLNEKGEAVLYPFTFTPHAQIVGNPQAMFDRSMFDRSAS